MKNNLTLTNAGRLNIDLGTTLIQNPLVQRLKVPATQDTHIHHRGRSKWIATWSQTTNDVAFGKLLTSRHLPNTTPIFFAEHWIYKDISNSPTNTTPRSRPTTIVPCQGCTLHTPYYVGSLLPKCIIACRYSNTIQIDPSTLKKKKEHFPIISLNYSKFQLLPHNHPYYRLLTYNDYLITHNLHSVQRQITAPPLIEITCARPFSTNEALIPKIIEPTAVAEELIRLSNILLPFNIIDFFTDGSFNPEISEGELHMGYG